jgi:integrase
LTLEQARKEAQKLAGRVAGGADPAAERAAQRLEFEREKNTVAMVADEFIDRYAKPKLRSWHEYQRILDRNIKPRLGRRPIHEVTRREITSLLDDVADSSGAPMADHVLAVLRKLLNWHATRDDGFQSPIVIGMARTSPKELARDRVLSDEEIRRIWAVLERQPYPFGPLVKLLFLTAQRRQEVTEMRWDEIQDDTWTIPARRYKTKIAIAVPLVPQAMEIVRNLPNCGQLLFTTTGTTPFSGFSKAKAHLDEASGVSDWVLHDVRRTCRTLMVRANVRPDIAERVLGHVIPGVAGTYDRHDYLNEKRDALEALASRLRSIITDSSNIVGLDHRRLQSGTSETPGMIHAGPSFPLLHRREFRIDGRAPRNMERVHVRVEQERLDRRRSLSDFQTGGPLPQR